MDQEFTEFTEHVNHVGSYVEIIEKHGFSTEYINVLINMPPMPELCEYLALYTTKFVNTDINLEAVVVIDGAVTIDNKKITNMLETFAVWLKLTEFIDTIPEIPDKMSIYSYIPEPIIIDFPDFDEESIISEPIADEDTELFIS